MKILVDYNLNRQALLLSGSLMAGEWLSLVPIQLVIFADVGLAMDSSDRHVWRFAQENQLVILTGNRNAKGDDSLEEVMREENTILSFPILTIGDPDRVKEYVYRERCVERLVEIAIDLQNYMGAGRIFIP
jgi:hypothetical protein